jgi:hypothetical protein
MTLIEILISLSLTALLISSLLTIHILTNQSYKQSKKQYNEGRELHNVYLRLYQTFKTIEHYKQLNTAEGGNFFFTENNELFFTFDNGANIESWLTGNVMAKIFVDDQNNLCLETSPVKPEGPSLCVSEKLFSDIEKISFKFFHTKTNIVHSWDKETRELPIIAWLKVYKKDHNKPFKFGFELSKKNHRQGNPLVKL